MCCIEFAKQVRDLEERGELSGHLPIIAVTANVRSTHVNVAIESGMVSKAILPGISTMSH